MIHEVSVFLQSGMRRGWELLDQSVRWYILHIQDYAQVARGLQFRGTVLQSNRTTRLRFPTSSLPPLQSPCKKCVDFAIAYMQLQAGKVSFVIRQTSRKNYMTFKSRPECTDLA